MEDDMGSERDKCLEQMNFRVNDFLYNLYKNLPPNKKNDVIEDLKVAMAKSVHNAVFDPEYYLSSNKRG